MGLLLANQFANEVKVTAALWFIHDLKNWLERLWQAYQDDGVDYTQEVSDRWGELCGSDEVRKKWLDELLPRLLVTWSHGTAGGYYRGTTACLSCLLTLGRYEELLELVNRSPSGLWYVREYGVKALVAQGRHAEAVLFAEASRDRYQSNAQKKPSHPRIVTVTLPPVQTSRKLCCGV